MKKNVILALFLTIISPFSAQAGIIEFLFPTLNPTEPDPSQTLVAPFALNENTEIGEIAKLPVNSVPLDQPHRLSADMTNWIAITTVEALNFLSPDYKTDLTTNRKNFDNFGHQQYTTFLTQTRILETLQTGKYRVRSYNENTPLLLNEGVVDGRFRWLYRVPIMITYLDAGANSYENVKPINYRATIDIQIGRNENTQDSEGVLIERWSGKLEAVE